jgi:hypothetical protein
MTMRRFLFLMLALGVLAGTLSACAAARYRGGDYRGGTESVD